MSDIAIKVRGLGKKYYIGERMPQRTLADSLKTAVKYPYHLTKGILTGKGMETREEFWALDDVSFDVKQGEVLGIIGRNGAGKSTLLKILSRIVAPTRGEVEMTGRVGSLLEVGTGFHPELTGRENIYFNGSLLGMTKAEVTRKLDEIVDFSGVEKFIDTPVKFYSSGMYTRLAFAVAAHLEPEILIVDEVLAVGDAEFQKKCLGKMDSIAKSGRTVLFVSHNMQAVQNLCSHAVVLQNGKKQYEGPVDIAIERYLIEMKQTMKGAENIDSFRASGFKNAVTNVKFSDISVENKEVDSFNFCDDIIFKVRISSQIDYDDLSIGASFFNNLGNCVATLFTSNVFKVDQGTTKEFNLIVPSFGLAPGHYYMGFSLGQGGFESNRVDFDQIMGYPFFEISATEQTEQNTIVNWDNHWGNIAILDAYVKE